MLGSGKAPLKKTDSCIQGLWERTSYDDYLESLILFSLGRGRGRGGVSLVFKYMTACTRGFLQVPYHCLQNSALSSTCLSAHNLIISGSFIRWYVKPPKVTALLRGVLGEALSSSPTSLPAPSPPSQTDPHVYFPAVSKH